jgi:DnaJ-class molecular chaperone
MICCVAQLAFDKRLLMWAGDVIVVLEQEKHAHFTRLGNDFDLHYTTDISVLDSLVGCSIELKSLSGKIFNVAVTDVVHHGFIKVIAGGGLPTGEGSFGDIIVHFNVQFPTSLRLEQKALLRVALALPKILTAEQQQAITQAKNVFAG